MKRTILAVILALTIAVPCIAADAVKPANLCVKAYFFHGWLTNKACELFEKTLRDVVAGNYKKEAEAGKIIIEVYDVEKPETGHYGDDYELVAMPAMVFSLVKDGKEEKWVELKKLRGLSEDPKKLKEYIEAELKSFLKEDK